MDKVINFDSIGAFNNFNKIETRHSLISLANCSQLLLPSDFEFRASLYRIDLTCFENKQGTFSFARPGQPVEQPSESNRSFKYTLIFHPDLVQGSSLFDSINEWEFYSYATAISFRLNTEEQQLLWECMESVNFELDNSTDRHTKKLITTLVERLLNYGLRFYTRQNTSPENRPKSILTQFDLLLRRHLSSENIYEVGIPTVAFFADQMHHSANYFGDLIKKETGRTAQEYIRIKIVEEAKRKIHELNKSINDIAMELGFRYPQHFSRIFKNVVGKTPVEYRQAVRIQNIKSEVE